MILEVNCREPNPTDKTSFTPSSNNLGGVVTPGCMENPLVQATVEKAVQTKKTIIFLEDLIGNPTAKGMEEFSGLEQAAMNFRRQQILDDILRFSAKVSKLRR